MSLVIPNHATASLRLAGLIGLVPKQPCPALAAADQRPVARTGMVEMVLASDRTIDLARSQRPDYAYS